MRMLAVGILLIAAFAAGCKSSPTPINRQEEQALKLELVQEHATKISPGQRYFFLATRFGTEELTRERFQQMLRASEIQARSGQKGSARNAAMTPRTGD